jgi:exodeoxyribonuclease VII large subunit
LQRLDAAVRSYVAKTRSRFELLAIQLPGLDPRAPLQRGFAMIYDGERLVRDASTVPPGTRITARLARGTLAARVEETGND